MEFTGVNNHYDLGMRSVDSSVLTCYRYMSSSAVLTSSPYQMPISITDKFMQRITVIAGFRDRCKVNFIAYHLSDDKIIHEINQ